MKREEIQKLAHNATSKSKKLKFESSDYLYTPFLSKFETLKNHEYNASYYTVYSLIANPKVHFVTVVSFYDNKYILKCGDPYLEGNMTEETITKLINTSLGKMEQKSTTLPSALMKSFNITPRSSACNFNQKNYEICDNTCEHIEHFLSELPSDVLDNLYTNYYEGMSLSTDNGLNGSLATKFERYAFKKHLLLEGDKGSGKTYAATSWGKDKDITQVFIGGHEQFESIDFLGHYIQQKSGELIWKDGPLSEAFRLANNGKKVLLIIDEILRIPKRELNILISALSPIDNKYVLRTGRALEAKDDIAVEEVIRATTKNLWVIATTNVGAAYAVESMDEALIDRFKPIRKDTTENELQSILAKVAKKRKIPTLEVIKLMDFYRKMKRLHSTDIITKIVNIRHLSEALEIANKPSQIIEIIKDSRLLWVERDYNGYPVQDQIDAIDAVIRKVYD